MGRTTEEWVVNQDMGEAHLAEASFGEEIVVCWDDEGGTRRYGIVVGYNDRPYSDRPIDAENFGMFHIDVVEKRDHDNAPSGWTWVETGSTMLFPRSQFVVFGPANRDEPVHPKRPPEEYQPQSLMLELHDPHMLPFACALIDLLMADQDGTGEPAYDVRLDATVCDKKEHFSGLKRNHRHYRILVRPMLQPLMHDEIAQVLDIASRYELAAFHSNVGIEIRQPNDV